MLSRAAGNTELSFTVYDSNAERDENGKLLMNESTETAMAMARMQYLAALKAGAKPEDIKEFDVCGEKMSIFKSTRKDANGETITTRGIFDGYVDLKKQYDLQAKPIQDAREAMKKLRTSQQQPKPGGTTPNMTP